MTKNQKKAHELYKNIEDKEKISEEILYNAICYFELPPENVAELLLKLSAKDCENLSNAFADTREFVRKTLCEILASHDFSAPFHDEEIEDIIFYQISHGIPVS